MPTIYPLFKPHDWAHKDHVAHRLLSEKVEGVPIIAFGFDTGDNYQFVPRAQCEDIDALYKEALGNLSALDYSWELGNSHGLRFAASSGKEFSAEKLLDQSAMLECHRLLQADRIVAAAPRRTCLFATRDGLPADEMKLFIQLAMHTYHDDSYGHAPISPALFVLEKGAIVQVLFVEDQAQAPRANAESKPWWKFWG